MSAGARRRRWPWLVLAAVGLANVGLGVYGTAGAQEGGTTILGLDAVATSDGIGSTFGDPEAQPYPVAAGQIAHTTATLSTGPTGYALASTAWPGPLVANAGSLAVLLGGPPEASEANYAGRAEAFSTGPNEAELPGMRARAEGAVAEATAGAQDVEGQPGAATGEVQTISRSTYEADVLHATSSCTASDIGFAEGAVAIGSVRTEADASSDGTTGTAAGRTVVSGLTVGGQPAEVDENGVRFVDPIVAPVGEQILVNFGIEMFVAEPRTEQDGADASYQASPLVVLWEPPESGQLFVYSICGSEASVSIRSGAAFTAPTLPPASPPTPVLPSDPAPASRPASTSTPTSAAAAAPPATAPAAEPPPAVESTPAGFVRHLSIWPYIVGALCSVAAGIGLRRGREGLLAPRPVGAACPLEGARP